MISITNDRKMLGYELFKPYPDISCFVTTRSGGIGTGAYATFNCSPFCGDNDEVVASNQEKLRRELPGSFIEWVIPKQVHGTEVCIVDRNYLSLPADARKGRLKGVDAVVTQEPGYCVCVSTADCVPLLIYDRKHKAVAAVHAGWRGTVEGIVSRVLNVMEQRFGTSGKDVLAAMGPGISLASFEVGGEVYEAFESKEFPMQRIAVWKEEKQKYHIDLWEANRIQLHSFGVPDSQIECAGICSYIHHDEFFSARRLGIMSGRTLSGIMVNE